MRKGCRFHACSPFHFSNVGLEKSQSEPFDLQRKPATVPCIWPDFRVLSHFGQHRKSLFYKE